ncbi:protein kinase family protein [Priestia megaterium]|nr:protein kinase family protein [Priestia megaterium]
MNNTMKNQVCNLQVGTTISGKWHKKRYCVLRQLGAGATGVVYLVQSPDGQHAALKISFDNSSVTAEVNVLRNFSKVHRASLGPFLLDVDDWIYCNQALSFYVMEYVKGQPLLSFVSKRGKEWISILAMQLLGDLEELHKAGWVFGDLKPENLVVTGQPIKIRWIDVGGITLQGRAIKEFTDFYDRAYWGFGSRKAEPSYDLFSVTMVIIHSAMGKRISKTDHSVQQLKSIIKTNPSLQPYHHVLYKAITGQYRSASDMKQEMIHASKGYTRKEGVKKRQNVRHASTRHVKVKKKRAHLLETLILCTSVMFIYILYLFMQVL